MNELLRQLEIVTFLSQRRGASVSAVSEHLESLGYAASEPTVKRDVSELRHLGADIVADRAFGYRLMNWEAIKGTVRRWRQLEREREERLERGML